MRGCCVQCSRVTDDDTVIAEHVTGRLTMLLVMKEIEKDLM